MKKAELTILQMAESKKDLLFFVAITLLGAAIRLSARHIMSNDMSVFLLSWHEEIKSLGGFAALKAPVGNYGIPYQYLIAVMTYIPLKPAYCYKVLSCMFDFLLALAGARLAYALRQEKSFTPPFLVVYGIILIGPTVVLNSSAWGQCDSIYVFFLVMACHDLWLEKHKRSFVWAGIAFAFKLQAIFILPFLIFCYVKRKNFSIISGLGISALAFYVMQLPGLMMGRHFLDPILIYGQQADQYHNMWMNYPSVWVMVGNDYNNLQPAAILLTMSILGIGLYLFMDSAASLSDPGVFIGLLVWSAWTCVLFLPSMHERYGYFVDVLAVIHAVHSAFSKRSAGMGRYLAGGYAVAEQLCSAVVYGNYLFEMGNDLRPWSAVNIAAYVCCSFHVAETIRQAAHEDEPQLPDRA